MDGGLKDELWSYVQAHVLTGSAATHIQNTLSCSFIENGICVLYVFHCLNGSELLKSINLSPSKNIPAFRCRSPSISTASIWNIYSLPIALNFKQNQKIPQ